MASLVQQQHIVDAYRHSTRRIFFLDYDGTLVPFNDLPGQSIMNQEVRTVIQELAFDPRNLICIASGRTAEFLAQQFEGINVWLIAEHGYRFKEPHGNWTKVAQVQNDWKVSVKELFRQYVEIFRGSFIEEKESSLAFHYRMAGREAETNARPMILDRFVDIQGEFPWLELLDGNKVIEIKPCIYNKGLAASLIMQEDFYDFILAAGDDETDETLFAVMPLNAITIKIGRQPSAARYFIPGPMKFISFLTEMMTLNGP